MTMTQTEFDRLEAEWSEGGAVAAVAQLVSQLKESKQYHELFEALKLQARINLGLPSLSEGTDDQLTESQQNELEDGLIAACREVGFLLIEAGELRQGWMYLRPVGDKQAVKEALAKVPLGDENRDEFVEVALHEGLDPQRGFAEVLGYYGTCNAITTFESLAPQCEAADQQGITVQLVEHVHAELMATLKADIEQQQGSEPAESTLSELVADRDWLFGEHSYHIDTSHLAATVRFARLLEDPQHLRLAEDLTQYGRRLDAQFQYEGDEPFTELYPHHGLYFSALLGEDVEAALEHFRDRAENVPVDQYGLVAIEAFIGLLSRLGKHEEALTVALELYRKAGYTNGQTISLLELSEKSGDFQPLLDHYRQQQDILGFTVSLISAEENKSAD